MSLNNSSFVGWSFLDTLQALLCLAAHLGHQVELSEISFPQSAQ